MQKFLIISRAQGREPKGSTIFLIPKLFLVLGAYLASGKMVKNSIVVLKDFLVKGNGNCDLCICHAYKALYEAVALNYSSSMAQ